MSLYTDIYIIFLGMLKTNAWVITMTNLPNSIRLINSLSASLLLNIFLSFEVGIAHAIANFKWKENTSSLKN